MRIRIAFGIVIAAAASLSLVAAASACLTADLNVSPSAGPDDPVSFSISGIEPGATYNLSVEGQQVASGVNNTNNNGVSGSFSMPDLGSQAQTVYAYADTFHAADGDSFRLSKPISYEPPVSSTTDTPAASSSAPTVPPAPHHSQRHATSASHSAPGTSHHSTATPAASPAPAPAVDATSSNAGASVSAPATAAKQHSAHASASVPDRILRALGSTTGVGPAKVPTMGLLLMALIFIAGTALAGLVIYLSQTGPDPKAAIKSPAPLGHDPVEVELQEMIGNEMARQLLSDLELGEQLPSGPA